MITGRFLKPLITIRVQMSHLYSNLDLRRWYQLLNWDVLLLFSQEWMNRVKHAPLALLSCSRKRVWSVAQNYHFVFDISRISYHFFEG